jgi:dihydroorotate dehydrogenase electron transfer subunit
MYQETVKVLWNNRVGNEYYKIGLMCNKGYSGATPGQFIMLTFPGRMVPLLPRPFSIHRLIKIQGRTEGIELLYKVVGQGTKMLSGHRKGDVVNILGPLGNGFIFSNRYKRIFIVAGGVGVAPMLFLALYLQTKGAAPLECTVFLGGKSEDDLLCRDDFLRMGMKLHITTDDGSAGDRCFVTHPLETAVETHRPNIIYACGPLEMLKCVAGISEKHDVACQISIETIMACGMGACLGCAVERKAASGNYMHACLDGPVFDTKCLRL